MYESFNEPTLPTQAELAQIVAAQTVIIQEMSEHLALLRTISVYMLMQASADETDQTEAGNPWLKLKRDFVALMNPHIRRLNQLMGVTAPTVPDPPKIAVVKA